MRMKHLALAGAALLLSAGATSAAVVTHGLNLRSGPSTRYDVIGTMPAGAHVRVLNCTGAWCRVAFRGERGYASANYLAGGRHYTGRSYRGRTYARDYYRSRPYYGGPTVVYGGSPYYGSGWGWNSYAYEPGFSFGIGFGGPSWYHHGYRHWYR